MKKVSPLLILFLTIFIDLIGFGLVLPLLPNYAREMGASPLWIGIIAASYSLMQFFFAPFWGRLSDKFGRRPIILISVLTSVISYLIFSHAKTIPLLIFSRLLSGIGSGNISAAQAYITDITDASNRSKGMGVIGAAFGLGFIFGPPIGGLVKHFYSIEMVGYVAAFLSLTDFLLAYFFLPESLKEKKNDVEINIFQFDKIFASFNLPAIGKMLVIYFGFILAFANIQVVMPLLGSEHYDLDDQKIGYLFAFIGLISALIQGRFIGGLSKKFGENKLLLSGNALMCLGILMLPFTPKNTFGIVFAFSALTLLAAGYGLSVPTSSSLVSLFAEPEFQGERLGVMQSIGSLARIAGPFSGGIFYGLNYHFPYLFSAVLLLISVFLISKLPKPNKAIN